MAILREELREEEQDELAALQAKLRVRLAELEKREAREEKRRGRKLMLKSDDLRLKGEESDSCSSRRSLGSASDCMSTGSESESELRHAVAWTILEEQQRGRAEAGQAAEI